MNLNPISETYSLGRFQKFDLRAIVPIDRTKAPTATICVDEASGTGPYFRVVVNEIELRDLLSKLFGLADVLMHRKKPEEK